LSKNDFNITISIVLDISSGLIPQEKTNKQKSVVRSPSQKQIPTQKDKTEQKI
jgi:hypothetical protein